MLCTNWNNFQIIDIDLSRKQLEQCHRS